MFYIAKVLSDGELYATGRGTKALLNLYRRWIHLRSKRCAIMYADYYVLKLVCKRACGDG